MHFEKKANVKKKDFYYDILQEYRALRAVNKEHKKCKIQPKDPLDFWNFIYIIKKKSESLRQ